MSEATVVLESTLVCPACGATRTETMPVDSCQYFYECTGATCSYVKARPDLGAPDRQRLGTKPHPLQ
jgi:hypothetical protein